MPCSGNWMTVGTRFMRTSQSSGLVLGSVLWRVLEHRALRLLRSPRREGQLVGMHQCELPALERTGDRGAADLLPIAARLLVAHEEVLIVDARQMKRQAQSRYISRPHQTGVTERSIRRDDRGPSYQVIDDMVITHGSDRIRTRAAADLHHDQLVVFVELCLAGRSEFRLVEMVKHQLVNIHARKRREHTNKRRTHR